MSFVEYKEKSELFHNYNNSKQCPYINSHAKIASTACITCIYCVEQYDIHSVRCDYKLCQAEALKNDEDDIDTVDEDAMPDYTFAERWNDSLLYKDDI